MTVWGSHPSPPASSGAVNTHRQGFSILFSLWTLLIFQPRHRLLYSGLILLSTDLLLLIPTVDHGLLWVRRRKLKDSKTLHTGTTTQSRDGRTEVWREIKLLPPLCKGPQLIPVDFPGGHHRDQVSDGSMRATKGLPCKPPEVCRKTDTGKGRNVMGKKDPTSKEKFWEGLRTRKASDPGSQQPRGIPHGNTVPQSQPPEHTPSPASTALVLNLLHSAKTREGTKPSKCYKHYSIPEGMPTEPK